MIIHEVDLVMTISIHLVLLRPTAKPFKAVFLFFFITELRMRYRATLRTVPKVWFTEGRREREIVFTQDFGCKAWRLGHCHEIQDCKGIGKVLMHA